jgi:hypothetical protein
MKYSLKILAISALTMIAVFAVNASAAQAFKLFKNGSEVSELNLTGKSSEGLNYLVPDLKMTVHCGETHEKVRWVFFVIFWYYERVITHLSCEVVGNKNCAATIEPLSAKGKLEMSGSEDFSIGEPPSGGALTTMYLEGALCTLPEEEPITGTIRTGLPNPEAELTSHESTLDESSLKYGTHTMFIDGEGAHTAAHGTIENAGAKFSAHL